MLLHYGCATTVGYYLCRMIVALAPNILDRLMVGDSVFETAQTNSMWENVPLSIVEFALCQADVVAKIPDRVSYIDAALPLSCRSDGLKNLKSC